MTLVFKHKGRYSLSTKAFLPNVPEQDITISFSLSIKWAYLPWASSSEIILAFCILMMSLLMHLMLINLVPLLTYCQFLIPGPSWKLKILEIGCMFHPSGIIPNSESTNFPPLNGSKSTNHDLNNACVCCSKLSFIRRFSSILESRAYKIDTISFWIPFEGIFTSNSSIIFLVSAFLVAPPCDKDNNWGLIYCR